MSPLLSRAIKANRGSTVSEYAMLCCCLCVVCLSATTLLGGDSYESFDQVNDAMVIAGGGSHGSGTGDDNMHDFLRAHREPEEDSPSNSEENPTEP